MLIKIVSLMFDSAYGGFKDDDLREFLKDKELISSTDHFFIRNDVPYITFILKYFPHRAEVEAAKTSTKEKPSEAWRESLSEHEMGLFNILRDWRSQRCKKEGVPPYVVFTNQQLADIVKRRPQTISELTQIEGVGKSKTLKYGEDVLAISKVDLGIKQEALPIA